MLVSTSKSSRCPMQPSEFVHNSTEVMEYPYDFYSALRANAPVYREPSTGYFIVSNYALVSKVLMSASKYSSDVGDIAGLTQELRKVFIPIKTLLIADPPIHTRHKGLVMRALSAVRIQSFRGAIQKIIDELIEAFIDKGSVDFFREFAMPLPLTVIADQLGVPRSYSAKFRQWSDAMVVPMAPSSTDAMREAIIPTLTEMNDFFTKIFLEKRINPTDDIISELASAEIDPIPGVDPPGTPRRQLTLVEGQSIVQLLMVAGNESSTAALCACLEYLAQNPVVAEQLRMDPHLVPPACDEILRVESPFQGFWRVATGDSELGGVAIPKGALLFVSYAAGNRDDEQFPQAHDIDPRRSNLASQLAFGKGIHFCPGATLAHAELEMATASLLRRMTNIRLTPGTEKLSHFPTTLTRGLTGLHLTFDKAS